MPIATLSSIPAIAFPTASSERPLCSDSWACRSVVSRYIVSRYIVSRYIVFQRLVQHAPERAEIEHQAFTTRCLHRAVDCIEAVRVLTVVTEPEGLVRVLALSCERVLRLPR
mgnify:CR=1 FL=1